MNGYNFVTKIELKATENRIIMWVVGSQVAVVGLIVSVLK